MFCFVLFVLMRYHADEIRIGLSLQERLAHEMVSFARSPQQRRRAILDGLQYEGIECSLNVYRMYS